MSQTTSEGMTATGSYCCYLCGKEIATTNSATLHKRDNHDGGNRIHPLKCIWCSHKPFVTRTGLAKHLKRCDGVNSLVFPLPCPSCGNECQDSISLANHSTVCFSWEQDPESDELALCEFEKDLIRTTRHPATARFINTYFQKVEVKYATGEKDVALVIPGGHKRWHSGSIAHVHPLAKRRVLELEVVEETNLDVALEAHAYGRLVSMEEYKLHDNKDALWHLPFLNNGERLAVMFQEMMIQSGDDILLALKVEVNGTDIEDPHAQELVRPTGKNAFKVENVYHDQTHKVMVGGVKWCILVTLAVMLMDGTVVVGPDNKFFHPKVSSRIWLKKNQDHGLFNTMARQLRSKFNEEATFAFYAAVHPLLNHTSTMPVTLATLYAFKRNNAWSGVKLAAFVFYQLFSQRRIVKAEVQNHLEEVLNGRGGKSCQNIDIIERMIDLMANEEVFPVSNPVNKCLTELAGNLSGEITKINNKEVMEAVVKKIKSMAV